MTIFKSTYLPEIDLRLNKSVNFGNATTVVKPSCKSRAAKRQINRKKTNGG